MSEAISPSVVPDTPIAAVSAGAGPGPATDTTPPGAGADAVAAPAADSLSPAAEPKDPLASSLLSDTKAPEAEAAAPEAVAPEEVKAPEPIPLPAYDAFATPEGFKLADEQLGAFTGILGEYEQKLGATPEAHVATQELGQKLVDLYIAETQEAQQRFARFQQENWQRTIDGWVSDFKNDPDIGDKRQDTTIQRCGAALQRYGSEVGAEKEQALRQVLAVTGAGNHPEVVRFVNWVADQAVERGRMIAAPPRPVSLAASKASRLYRNSITGAA